MNKELEKMRDSEERYKARKSNRSISKQYEEDTKSMKDSLSIIQRIMKDKGITEGRTTKKTIEYSKKTVVLASLPSQLMEYTEALKEVLRIAENLTAQRRKVFVLDVHNKGIYENATKWAILDPSSSYSLYSGLYISGPVGTGKTILARAIKTFINQLAAAHKMRWMEMREAKATDIWDKIEESKNISLIKKYTTNNWVFDDFGEENTLVGIYGKDYPLFSRIISKRDGLTNIRHKRIIITSNKDIYYKNKNGKEYRETLEKYGSRTHRRLQEMFPPSNRIILKGIDRGSVY